VRRSATTASAAALASGPVAAAAVAVVCFMADVAHDPGPRLIDAVRAAGLEAAPLAADTGQLETRLNLEFGRRVERLDGAAGLARWLESSGRGGAIVLRATLDAIPPGARSRARLLVEDWQFARVSWRSVRENGLRGTWESARVGVVAIERLDNVNR